MLGPNPGGGARVGGNPGGGRPGGLGGPGALGGGSGFSEAGDENAIKQALAGAGVGPGAGSTSGGGSNPGGSNAPGGAGSKGANLGNQGSPTSKPPVEPREVGTIGEEIKRGVGDAWEEVKKFFSINTWLGIDPEEMSPEDQAKAKEFHARYQQLDQEQQAVAKQMYQERMQKKKMEEEEDRRKKEIEAQKKAQSVQMPSSPQKGAAGPGGKSKKGRAMQKLQQDRTTIGTTQGE